MSSEALAILRGSTPRLRVRTTRDLSEFARVVLTFKCKCAPVDVERDRMEFFPEDEDGMWPIEFSLTQEETLLFSERVKLQVRYANRAGYAGGSWKKEIKVEDILKDGVLEVE